MRNLITALIMAFGILAAAMPAMAADYPQYPEPQYPVYQVPDLPPVDYGLGGSFYLRGSAAYGFSTALEARYGCNCVADITANGYGYSFGVGAGYETGTGFRADATIDYLSHDGLTDSNGYKLKLRSTLGMANVYYDFGFGDNCCGGGSAAGGFGAYVGAGIGAAYNHSESEGCGCDSGNSVEAAGALMAGVTYDMGSVVADLGYRMIYMNKITNQSASPYYVNNNFIHEVRGTVRYRF